VGANVIAQVLMVLQKQFSRGHITSCFTGIQLFFNISHPSPLKFKKKKETRCDSILI
jgi:hypothetical protein